MENNWTQVVVVVVSPQSLLLPLQHPHHGGAPQQDEAKLDHKQVVVVV